jgi:hypothetical protein
MKRALAGHRFETLATMTLALSGVALTGCPSLDPPPAPPQIVVVNVTSDPGVPMPGAELLFNGKAVGRTDDNGVGQLKLNGNDGDVFQVMVKCPEGYASPTRPISVQLRRLADQGKYPEYEASCPPTMRTIVVAVRAENGAGLPVVHLSREIARTDESGAAHVLFNLPPGESFDLMLDTSKDENLKPQNPVASFTVSQRDDVFLFDQKFDKPEKKVFYKAAAPKPSGPVKIGGK